MGRKAGKLNLRDSGNPVRPFSESFDGTFWTFFDYFENNFENIWDLFEAIFGIIWKYFGTVLGHFLGLYKKFATLLEPF